MFFRGSGVIVFQDGKVRLAGPIKPFLDYRLAFRFSSSFLSGFDRLT